MMKPSNPVDDPLAGISREEMLSALFANMVVQQANMALMLLGKVPHPETGEIVQDLETARLLIDQLEMLSAKTKGNLTKEEDALLKKALSSVHMAFVETVDHPTAPAKPPTPSAPAPTPPKPAAEPAKPQAATTPSAAADSSAASTQPDESRKKFSKKY